MLNHRADCADQLRRTLQEGVVSERTIFQFRGSFAILNILHKVVEHLSHDTADSPSFLRVMLHMLFGVDYPEPASVPERLDYDPLAGAMAADMLRIVKASLDTRKSMYDYPLKPVSLKNLEYVFRMIDTK